VSQVLAVPIVQLITRKMQQIILLVWALVRQLINIAVCLGVIDVIWNAITTNLSVDHIIFFALHGRDHPARPLVNAVSLAGVPRTISAPRQILFRSHARLRAVLPAPLVMHGAFADDDAFAPLEAGVPLLNQAAAAGTNQTGTAPAVPVFDLRRGGGRVAHICLSSHESGAPYLDSEMWAFAQSANPIL